MTTLSQSATQPNTAIEKREASAYYKTLVSSGYAAVNGLQMYYEIHSTVSARPLVRFTPLGVWRTYFPSFLSIERQKQSIEPFSQGGMGEGAFF